MIDPFPDDEPEQPYEDLIRQRPALGRRIADYTTARARLEYQQSRLRQRGRDALNRLELVLRAREEQLTLRIRATRTLRRGEDTLQDRRLISLWAVGSTRHEARKLSPG